ncbi:MAG: hypothetical protein KGQ36_02165 [Rickettsiales bacterium]|nr:hypothetical protein [Rickettsiales bacterium]
MKILLIVFITSLVVIFFVMMLNYASYNGGVKENTSSKYNVKNDKK